MVGYAVLFLIFLLASAIIESQAVHLEEIASELEHVVGSSLDITDAPETIASDAENVYTSLKSVLIKVGVAIALFVILVFIILLLFKSIIWSIILKKKFSRSFYLKFIFANVVWFFVWIALFAILLITKLPTVIIYRVLLIFMVFFTLVFLSLFDEKKPVLTLIKKSFTFGIRKIHKLILALILACLLMITLSILLQLVYIIPLIILFIAWFRIYTFLAVKNLLVANQG